MAKQLLNSGEINLKVTKIDGDELLKVVKENNRVIKQLTNRIKDLEEKILGNSTESITKKVFKRLMK